jgi:hypothetical protein
MTDIPIERLRGGLGKSRYFFCCTLKRLILGWFVCFVNQVDGAFDFINFEANCCFCQQSGKSFRLNYKWHYL